MMALKMFGGGLYTSTQAENMKAEWEVVYSTTATVEEAVAGMVREFFSKAKEEYDRHEFWLVLAALMHSYGVLTEAVRAEALAVIDGGKGLECWEGYDLSLQKGLYKKLRVRFMGPMKAPKKKKKVQREITQIGVGQLVRVRTQSGKQLLLWAVRATRYRADTLMKFVVFSWEKERLPTAEEFAGLTALSSKNVRSNNEFIRDQRAKKMTQEERGGSEAWIELGLGGRYRNCVTVMPRGSNKRGWPGEGIEVVQGEWTYPRVGELSPAGASVVSWEDLRGAMFDDLDVPLKWEQEAVREQHLAMVKKGLPGVNQVEEE